MEFPSHILVVDDDSRLRRLLRQYLTDNGFLVALASNTAHARRIMKSLDFDLIILDVMMPGEDGYAFTRSIRETNPVPILMLTARGDVEDRIAGLEQGVNDYLPKPFDPRELLLRISNILNLTESKSSSSIPREIVFGDCVFNCVNKILKRKGSIVHLTSLEGNLLRTLAECNGNVVSRRVLLDKSQVEGSERTVDVQVTRLRRKIEPTPRWPRYLRTIRGRGYVLHTDSPFLERMFSLKKYLPKSLLGRSILIIVTPAVLTQVVATWVFYDRHWETVTRRLAASVAGEISSVIDQRQFFREQRMKVGLLSPLNGASPLIFNFKEGKFSLIAVLPKARVLLKGVLAMHYGNEFDDHLELKLIPGLERYQFLSSCLMVS